MLESFSLDFHGCDDQSIAEEVSGVTNSFTGAETEAKQSKLSIQIHVIHFLNGSAGVCERERDRKRVCVSGEGRDRAREWERDREKD